MATKVDTTSGTFLVAGATVSTLLDRPAGPRALLVLAHGAGAGMRHAFMADLTAALVGRDVAVFRYQFPYQEAGRRRIDPPAILEAAVSRAVEAAERVAPDLPRFAGGKSMGGRMTSRVAALEGWTAGQASGVRGLVFFGFPLHPAKKPATERAAHLPAVRLPMLFLQGTRDDLADLALVRGVTAPQPLADLHVVDGADHGFHVLKRSGRTDAEVVAELADQAVAWMLTRV